MIQHIRKTALLLLVTTLIFGCQQIPQPQTFSISGHFNNTGAKKIFLAELPFGSTQRTIVDTAALDEKGNFSLSTVSKGEGIYQVFVENGAGLMLINDADHIELQADAKNLAGFTTKGGRTNESLKKMYHDFIQYDSIYRSNKSRADSVQRLKIKPAEKDSLQQVSHAAVEKSLVALKRILTVFINTEPNGTAVYFATGIAKQFLTDAEWNNLLQSAFKRFPNHPGLQLMRVNSSSQNSMDRQGQEMIGKPVPDISLPDTTGKAISVSSFRGRWLLIDFWASWCAPCRAENPNVVQAFNQFKNKNFTVLGISLDLQKAAWLKAIQQDGLAWTHISDLKQWQSKAVDIYGVNGIPFNILVDPAGKVVAVNLRGPALLQALAAQMK